MENTGQILSEDKLNAAREQLGLDKPFLTPYFVWLGQLIHGDMGNSYVSGIPVFDTFISKLPETLLLTVTSILLTIIISIPLGILSAVKQNTITDLSLIHISQRRECPDESRSLHCTRL